jgi:hypothetical protein
MASIRFLLELAYAYDLEVDQMVVRTSFLLGELKEEIFMNQLKGFMVEGIEYMFCWLNISLYVFKQSPR